MIKLFFLMIFFFTGPYSLKADEVPGGDQEFKNELNNIKNPFEDGLPKPIVIINKSTPIYHEAPKAIVLPPMPQPVVFKPMPQPVVFKPMPQPVVFKPMPQPISQMPRYQPVAWRPPEPEIRLPTLKLQGVVVGEEMHQAIINDQVVPLLGTIEGARVEAVSKEGVELFFKGKKFFLKVD
jgi:hypothetical protein